MSAFIIADAHINFLVTWAAEQRVSFYWAPRREDIRGQEQRVAGILRTANVESVNALCGEDAPSDSFTFRPYAKLHNTPPAKLALVVLNACAGFDYQACEVDNYERTIAAVIVSAIRQAAIRALPGYDDAGGWHITD